MSRSFWALAETWRRGGFVRGAGEQRRLGDWLCRGRRLLPGVVSATKYTLLLLVAGMLVLVVERGHAHGALRLGVLLERWNDPQGALWAYQQAQASDHPEMAQVARERALALSRDDEQ